MWAVRVPERVPDGASDEDFAERDLSDRCYGSLAAISHERNQEQQSDAGQPQNAGFGDLGNTQLSWLLRARAVGEAAGGDAAHGEIGRKAVVFAGRRRQKLDGVGGVEIERRGLIGILNREFKEVARMRRVAECREPAHGTIEIGRPAGLRA